MTGIGRIGILSFASILQVAAPSAAVVAEAPGIPSAAAADLEVVYDPTNDRLRLQVRSLPLDRVLQQLATASSLTIDLPGDELLREETSLDLKDETVEEALQQLLEGFNWVALRGPANDAERSAARLTRIIVLSRKAGGATERHGAGSRSGPATGEGQDPVRSLLPNEPAELVRALLEDRGTVAAVKTSGPREVERAVEALAGALDREEFPTLEVAVEMVGVLNELASEQALDTLRAWLDGGDPRTRRVAIVGLGAVGGEAAIELLQPELTDARDPLARQMAANSLARVGMPKAMEVLFEAYRIGEWTGDESLKRTAATAIAREGDESAQRALAEGMLGEPVPDGTAPRDLIVDYLAKQEAGMEMGRRR